jgi:hypothetical protein
MPTFPSVRVGTPVVHEALTVFPLFLDAPADIDYLLSDEAMASGSVTVEEVNESGSVPNLVVDNKADRQILFLEGEELRGAKQNRVLNTSVLVAARTRMTIPVSCVERGRWRFLSPQFSSSGSHASAKLRHVLKKSVSGSACEGQGHSSNQGEVWREVDRQMSSFGVSSPTASMSDTYDSRNNRLTEFRERLQYVEGASGLAVAVAGRLVSVDLFDKPQTCRKVWSRLLSGMVMDALESAASQERPGEAEVMQVLAALRDAPWQQVAPAGSGEEFRAEAGNDRHASALTAQGTVIHASLVTAA